MPVTLRAKFQVSSDLNFDNHVRDNAQFPGQSDIKHMWQ